MSRCGPTRSRGESRSLRFLIISLICSCRRRLMWSASSGSIRSTSRIANAYASSPHGLTQIPLSQVTGIAKATPVHPRTVSPSASRVSAMATKARAGRNAHPCRRCVTCARARRAWVSVPPRGMPCPLSATISDQESSMRCVCHFTQTQVPALDPIPACPMGRLEGQPAASRQDVALLLSSR